MQQAAKLLQIAFYQGCAHLLRQFTNFGAVTLRLGSGLFALLLAAPARSTRITSSASEKKHQLGLQSSQDVRGKIHRLNLGSAIRVETNKIQSTKAADIHPACPLASQHVTGDMKSLSANSCRESVT